MFSMALKTRFRPCLWLKIINTPNLNCGGVRIDILSDIFKL